MFDGWIQQSQDDAIKQRDSLVNEVACLRMELQQVRDDRDRHQLQMQTLTAEYTKYKESTEKSCFDLDNLTSKKDELEVVYIILSFFLWRFVSINFC